MSVQEELYGLCSEILAQDISSGEKKALLNRVGRITDLLHIHHYIAADITDDQERHVVNILRKAEPFPASESIIIHCATEWMSGPEARCALLRLEERGKVLPISDHAGHVSYVIAEPDCFIGKKTT